MSASGITTYQRATIITAAATNAWTNIHKKLRVLPFTLAAVFFKIHSTTIHIANDARKATKYQRADFITIFWKRSSLANIERIKRDVETGIPLNLVKNTSIRGNITIYHSTFTFAYHLASRRPYVISHPLVANQYHITQSSTAATQP